MVRVLGVAACVAAIVAPYSVEAATVTVSTSAQLNAALKNAKDGDVVKVAPGKYGNLDIRNLHFTTPITLVASNASQMPVFSNLIVSDSTGIKITRLTVNSRAADPYAPALYAAEVRRSSDIRLSDMVFSGPRDDGLVNDPRGLRVSNSTKVTVATSSFIELSNGITTDGSSRLTVTDNAFSGIRVNGIISDGASNSVIARNRFSEFRREITDHADAIQIFAAKTTTDTLQITDNLILGDAKGQMQGIFISNDNGDRNMLDRINIQGNLLWGTEYNGIAAFDLDRVSVTNNRVYSNDDLGVTKAWIRLESANNAMVSGNYAASFNYLNLGLLTSVSNIASLADQAAPAAIAAWDATHIASQRLIRYTDPKSANSSFALLQDDSSLESFAASVPEPSAWLMMIAGFLLSGFTARQTREQRRLQRT